MSALTDNVIIETKKSPVSTKLKVVDGLIRIFKGALLEYELSNIGYVQPATADIARENQPEFAGISLDELDKSAALNTTDGTFSVAVMTRGVGDWIKLPVVSTITIANEGDPVYMDGDASVDIASGILNTTGGLVGIIRQFIGANSAWIQLTQHPIL